MNMDVKLALDNVKEAELKAQEIVAQAKKEARNILHEASLNREAILRRAQEQAGIDSQKLKAKIESETQQELEVIRIQAEKETNALKENAAANIDRAADFIIDKVEQSL